MPIETAASHPVAQPPAEFPALSRPPRRDWSERLRLRLTTPGASPFAWRLWLAVALALSTAYAVPDLRKAFSTPYVAQDDARQHVFWMRRFLDPGLFPGDPIADYFQSVAPAGYTALYRGAAAAGLDPLTASKVLPVALGWIAVGFGFALARRMLDAPAAALAAAFLFAMSVWGSDDLPSGTPRAFGVPLLTAFLYFLARRSWPGSLISLALLGLIYPQALLVAAATMALWGIRFEHGRPRLTRDRRDLALCVAGLGVAALSILPFALRSSGYGPVITAHEARALPDFWRGGRSDFYGFNPWHFWVEDQRSGLLPKVFASSGPFLFVSLPMLAGFGLPFLLRRPDRWPRAREVRPEVGFLARLGVASLVLFGAAHALLFKLHLPSRYSGLGAHVGLAVGGALVAALALDRALGAAGPDAPARARGRARLGLVLAAGLGAALAAAPFIRSGEGDYVIGRYPALYAFLARQPMDVRIASLSIEASNIPTFSKRSVLSSRETLIPYHTGYFRKVRGTTVALLRAEYADGPRPLEAFVETYGPDLLVVESDAFSPRWVRQAWLWQFHPVSDQIKGRLAARRVPFLARVLDRCAVFRERNLVVVDARCAASGEAP